jgi:hypothetical protein
LIPGFLAKIELVEEAGCERGQKRVIVDVLGGKSFDGLAVKPGSALQNIHILRAEREGVRTLNLDSHLNAGLAQTGAIDLRETGGSNRLLGELRKDLVNRLSEFALDESAGSIVVKTRDVILQLLQLLSGCRWNYIRSN